MLRPLASDEIVSLRQSETQVGLDKINLSSAESPLGAQRQLEHDVSSVTILDRFGLG